MLISLQVTLTQTRMPVCRVTFPYKGSMRVNIYSYGKTPHLLYVYMFYNISVDFAPYFIEMIMLISLEVR